MSLTLFWILHYLHRIWYSGTDSIKNTPNQDHKKATCIVNNISTPQLEQKAPANHRNGCDALPRYLAVLCWDSWHSQRPLVFSAILPSSIMISQPDRVFYCFQIFTYYYQTWLPRSPFRLHYFGTAFPPPTTKTLLDKTPKAQTALPKTNCFSYNVLVVLLNQSGLMYYKRFI